MRKRIRINPWWAIFAIAVLGLAVAVEMIGTIFFVNRTQSMPIGIYVKVAADEIRIGDVIVFNQSGNNNHLIKYVAAIAPAQFCIDERATFWVDDFPVAQLNTEKYPSEKLEQSLCQRLQTGEIFVLGDHPESYDSRYFGPVKINDVIARVELLWQFK